MMRRFYPAGPFARTILCASIPAALLLAPLPASADDERLVSHVYDSHEVVRINGKLGVQATIGFGEKESIETDAVGDAESWQITPNKRADLLFVKPLTANARTNMTVVTDKHTYFFDLVASPRTRPLYMLRFTYKDEPRPAPEGAGAPQLSEAEQQAISGDLAAAPADPASLNFAWRPKGDAGLLPARIYDDGASTYLLWDSRQRVPAILVLNEKGEEGPVNYAVRGKTIVIDDVPGKIVLRIGRKSASLENQRGSQAPAVAAPAADSAPAKLAPAAVAASDHSQPLPKSQ
jgi:type IV secretion system protein VirB9